MITEQQRGAPAKVQFGVFEADLRTGELRRSGIRVRIQTQPFRLLVALLQRAGEVVSRETLQQELWGADTTVDFDHSLGIAVNKLRDALGDSAENPIFVETLAKRGYRFIAPLKVIEPLVEAEVLAYVPVTATSPTKNKTRSRLPYWPVLAIASTCICLILLGLLLLRPARRTPYRIRQVTHTGHVMANDVDLESFSSSASDGARLYFSQVDSGVPVLAVALTANGEINNFGLPSEIGAPLISALAPDGSKLIVRSHLQADPEQPLWIVPTLGGDARRVPSVLAHDATWMPDGNRLLVASGTSLTITDADGSNAHPFLTTPGRAFWLRWSPDGKTLRYTLRDPQRQTSELWEVDASGRNPHPLLPGWSHPASECCGSWTSDGREFIFQSYHQGHSDIWALDRRTGLLGDAKPRQITNGPLDYEAPTAAPHGHRVDFIGVNWQIELLGAVPGTSSFTALGQNLSAAALAVYSPDGKWVAWLNAADGSLWRSRADGTERIEVCGPPLRIFNMRWSPDNKQLVIMGEEPGKPWKVYLVDSEGGLPLPALPEDRNQADPGWFPDGQSIVFGRLPDRMDAAQPKAIYVLDLKTHDAQEVPGSTGLFSPRVSPDGRYIAAMRLDQRALMLFDRTQQRWTTLTTHGVGDPTWSHDGHFLYFQDFLEAGLPIYRIAVPGGQPGRVATIDSLRPVSATDYRLIGLAPGDRPMVSARTSSVNLYEVDLDEK